MPCGRPVPRRPNGATGGPRHAHHTLTVGVRFAGGAAGCAVAPDQRLGFGKRRKFAGAARLGEAGELLGRLSDKAEHRFEGARRSTGMTITGQTRVYLADTLGEMGLWYALSPLTCVCGSFTDVGGHNPFEPAHAGSAVLHGPRYANFAEAYAQMQAENACIEVAGAISH